MTTKWPIMKRSLRRRLRVHVLRRWWWVRLKTGRCRHPATWGPAGGPVGSCAVCGVTVDWTEDE